ncbi:Htr-like protein [Halorhabdus tiamatea SARL4B]|uniref:Htr-like protein n=1 Tax=Halorhabdus tiamatea SARL4B TaxID=1033806 RepID=F7PHS4_9EURY|nr:response regulator [Halorhabdus tiamatea]ERJ06918.1 Htr-like protein [Halorhabdus tiamatea SARL4B]CCQ32379.1 signal transduction response regulator [Halorhabdus tiamatea SARL4B]
MPDEITVLLVDEDQDILDVTATFLERADDDMHAETYANVVDALDSLASAPEAIDCVISDYTMPEMTGVEFLERARKIDPALPFFAFTGREREDIKAELDDESFTGYVKKGTGTERYEELATEIRDAVEE